MNSYNDSTLVIMMLVVQALYIGQLGFNLHSHSEFKLCKGTRRVTTIYLRINGLNIIIVLTPEQGFLHGARVCVVLVPCKVVDKPGREE